MKHIRWLALLLAGIGPLADAGPARAQRPQPSLKKKAYIHFQGEGDLSRILSDRLLQKRGEMMALDKVLEHFRKNPLPFKLDQFDAKSFQDPALRREFRKFLDAGRKEHRLNPDEVKALENLLKDRAAPPNPVEGPGAKGHLDPPALPKGNLKQGPPGPNPLPAAPEPAAPEPGLQEKLAELAQNWAHRLEGTRIGDTLRNSRGWQHGLRSLEGFLSDQGGSRFRLPGGGLGNLGERLRLQNWRLTLPDLGQLKMPTPSMPALPRPELDLDLPRFNLGGGLPGAGLPNVGGPGLAATQGILWVGLAILIGVVLWRLRGRVGGQGRRIPADWQLGPWPVNPAQIATRADLVRAFEYLALLRLGPEARAWNHCEIAAHLAGPDSPQRRAVDKLAALYEQARYAPGDGPLAPSDLDAARRNLCLLAGVATA